MTKRTKTETTTDQEPAPPSIEETIDAMSTAFLNEVDAVGKKHARRLETTWHEITPSARLSHARQVRVMFQAGLRKPAVGVDLTDLPREALGLRP